MMAMWVSRSITNQLKKTCMSVILLPSSSSSVKLFTTTTTQSFVKNCPYFLLLPLPITFRLRCFSGSTTTLSSKPSFFSTFPSSHNNSSHGGSFTVNDHPSSSYSEDVHDSRSSSNSLMCINKEDDQRGSIPIRAYYFSTSFDLKSLMYENQVNFIPPICKVTNHVLLRFFKGGGYTNYHPCDLEASLSGSSYSYMVVFQYGSVVMFNIAAHEVDWYLKIIERYASGLQPENRKDCEVFLHNEIKYEVREDPKSPTWMQVGLDYIMLQHLDIDCIRTIACVLGQSITLDYYVRQVDGVLAEFTCLFRGNEKFITYISRRKRLNQIVGKANSKLADVILKNELFERLEIVRKDAKYAEMWNHLGDIFKLTHRFASLQSNLKLVEEYIHFLSEEMDRKLQFLSISAFRISFAMVFMYRVYNGTYW